jgi:hypothetical protein
MIILQRGEPVKSVYALALGTECWYNGAARRWAVRWVALDRGEQMWALAVSNTGVKAFRVQASWESAGGPQEWDRGSLRRNEMIFWSATGKA